MNTWQILSRSPVRALLAGALLSTGCQSVPASDNVVFARLVPERKPPVANVPQLESEPSLLLEVAPETPDTIGEAEPVAPGLSRALLSQILAERASRIPPEERAEMVDVLWNAHEDRALDPLLILGMIEQESRFKPKARGPHGSLGLMQVRPFVGKSVAERIGMDWRGAKTLLDPSSNLRIGIAYLHRMVLMYGEEELALAAYNMGPYRLKRMLRRGGFPRGTYAGKVYGHRDEFEMRFTEPVAADAR